MHDEDTVDLLVLGGGMAGATAAARALEAGASVVLVEKGPAMGGSAMYAGFIWTAPTLEVMREVNPDADLSLSARLVDGYSDALDWVRSLGVTVGEPVSVIGYGRGCAADIANLLLTCERRIREDGELVLNAHAQQLLVEDGRVCGATIVTADGDTRRIAARSTLLATGGFGGDADLRATHIHPQARDIALRANPHSTGDGLRLARAAGAASGPENAGFYGHLIPSGIRYDDPYEFAKLTFYHSEHGVLLNLDGRRFCDETEADHLSTLAVLEQPEARALLVTDQRVHDRWMMGTPYVEGAEPVDAFALAYKRGARAAIAEELEEFAYLQEWGYPGEQVRDALQALSDGHRNPSRRRDPAPLVDPPYYVIEVVPAITFTFGGIGIDAEARVLAAGGAPMPGLLAAGADAGGVFVRAYAGGLAAALVFGLQAADTALLTRV
jgi:succinate dehydrogenase/fumarate reductase flavoprotein subunit